ncbi:HIT family protein [Flavimarina sp. Hel_I_48]|uniref:HIT family protein n=1 Tax=Flavimarina sp. Hel_I_48 TaxID=1392488 RepID=UPI0004DF688A|nr:HIT family protein [Flavimarina sp. Hel_I_48]
MASIFTKIINKEIPATIVYEDDKHIAILDVHPNAKGHTLCIPKKEVNKVFDLEEQEYIDLMLFSRKVANGLEKSVSCKRIGLSVIGLEVPHVHVHLIPLSTMEDARFTSKVKVEEEEMKSLGATINNNIG